MTAPRLRTIILGCGNIAGGFDATRPADADPLTHAGALVRHGGFELVACVDPDLQRAQGFAERWGVGGAHGTAEALAGLRGGVDVVVVASPTDLHEEHVGLAIDLGARAVFCEKPIAPTLPAATRMVEACARAGVLMAVNHTRRWAPDVVELARDLRAGRHGPVRSAYGLYNKGVLNNGSHMVDLAAFLLGDLTLAWAGSAVADHWPDDPTIPFTLVAEGGVPVQVGVGYAADTALFELQIVAAEAVIAMEAGGARWRVRRPIDNPDFRGYKSLAVGEPVDGTYRLAMAAAVENLHAAVIEGRALASTGRTALAAQALCEAIRSASGADTASLAASRRNGLS
ncbi:Gfo/Idh/MocA family protein [Salinarimonas rosea]|uniref:Gfo/Idh/MocA family protein n=1 Tax=Salinarimonas rosea TaxID=552063 RepID=UPI0004069548|nr:Gfo/Idh/MocA family oxidoreductase [Salinarimonas rosea]